MNISQLQSQPLPQVQKISKLPLSQDATFLRLRLLNKRSRIRLSPENINLDSLPGKGHLFAVANAKGWFVAATRLVESSNALIASPLSELRTAFATASAEESLFTPQRTFSTQSAIPNLLAFTHNETRLLVGLAQGQISVFDTGNLFSPGSDGVLPLHVFQSPSGTPPKLILPNPGDMPALVAVLREPSREGGAVQTVEILDVERMESVGGWSGGNTTETTPTTLSWSPKGKQLSIGLLSGSILAFSPSDPNTPKSHFPPPPFDTPQSILSTTWLTNSLHHTIYTPLNRSGPDQEQTHFLLSLDSKAQTATSVKINAPCLPFPGMRPPSAFTLVLKSWGQAKILLFVGDSASSDIGALVCNTSDEWANVSLDETTQPSMPLDKDMMDTVLVGLELDLTEQGENDGGKPVMYAYASDGTLTGWHLSSTEEGMYPGMVASGALAVTGTMQSDTAMTPSSVDKTGSGTFTQSSPSTSGSAFGLSSVPASSGPFEQVSTISSGSAFGHPSALAPGSAFGQSKFGQSSFSLPSAFGPPSPFGQSSFGQPSAFGQQAKATSASPPPATGGFGAFSSSGPAKFGQSSHGFGSNSPPEAPAAHVMQRGDSMSDSAPAPTFGAMSLGTTLSSPPSPSAKPSIFGQTNPSPLPLPPDHPSNQPLSASPTTSVFGGSSVYGAIKPAAGFGAFGGGGSGGVFSNVSSGGGASAFGNPSQSQPVSVSPSFGKSGFEAAKAFGFGQSSTFGKPNFGPQPSPAVTGGISTSMDSGGFSAFSQGGSTSFAAAQGDAGGSNPSWASGGQRDDEMPKSVFGAGGSVFGGGVGGSTAVPSRALVFKQQPPSRDSPTPPKVSAPLLAASPPSDVEGSPPLRSTIPSSPSMNADSPAKSTPTPTSGAFSSLKTAPMGFLKPATGFGAFGSGELESKLNSPFYNPQRLEKARPLSVFASSSGATMSSPESGSPAPTFGATSALGSSAKHTFGATSSSPKSAFAPATSSSSLTTSSTSGGFSVFSGTKSAFASYAGPQKSFGDLLKCGGDEAKDPEKSKPLVFQSPKVGSNDENRGESPVSDSRIPSKPATPTDTHVSTFGLVLSNKDFSRRVEGEKGKDLSSAPSSPGRLEHQPATINDCDGNPDGTEQHLEAELSAKEPAAAGGLSQHPSLGSLSVSSQNSSFVDVTGEDSESDAEALDHEELDDADAPVDDTNVFLSDDGYSDPSDASGGIALSEDEDDDENVSSLDDPAAIALPSTPSRSPSATPKPESPVIHMTPRPPPKSLSPSYTSDPLPLSQVAREASTTPPGSPTKETPMLSFTKSPIVSPTPITPSPTTALGIGMGRPSTRPARSSPLATVPVSVEEPEEGKDMNMEVKGKDKELDKKTDPASMVTFTPLKPQPASPKPAFGQWSGSVKPMETRTSSGPKPYRPKTPPLLSGQSAINVQPFPLTTSAVPNGPQGAFLTPPHGLPSFSSGLFPPPPFSSAGLPSGSPSTPAYFGRFDQPASLSPETSLHSTRTSIAPPAPPVPSVEEGIQAHCMYLFTSLARELKNLSILVEETAENTAIFRKPYFGLRSPEDLWDPSKWSLGDVSQFGQAMKLSVKDIHELRQKRDVQLHALKVLESDMLKASTRKEEIIRFNKAKTDNEFAKMLKLRTLGPEHLETQSQLRRDISGMRDRIQKLEDHLKVTKKRLHQLKTGKPGIKPPSLDTISRTYRNIDFVANEQAASIANLTVRISKLDLSSSIMHYSTCDPRLPNPIKRPLDITPSIPATTAAALNAELSAQKLKRALLSLRQEPLLNTMAATAPHAPPGQQTVMIEPSFSPNSLCDSFRDSLAPGNESNWLQSPWDHSKSPASTLKARRGVTGTKHSKPVPIRKCPEGGKPATPPFNWGPVPKLQPMETISPDVRKTIDETTERCHQDFQQAESATPPPVGSPGHFSSSAHSLHPSRDFSPTQQHQVVSPTMQNFDSAVSGAPTLQPSGTPCSAEPAQSIPVPLSFPVTPHPPAFPRASLVNTAATFTLSHSQAPSLSDTFSHADLTPPPPPSTTSASSKTTSDSSPLQPSCVPRESIEVTTASPSEATPLPSRPGATLDPSPPDSNDPFDSGTAPSQPTPPPVAESIVIPQPDHPDHPSAQLSTTAPFSNSGVPPIAPPVAIPTTTPPPDVSLSEHGDAVPLQPDHPSTQTSTAMPFSDSGATVLRPIQPAATEPTGLAPYVSLSKQDSGVSLQPEHTFSQTSTTPSQRSSVVPSSLSFFLGVSVILGPAPQVLLDYDPRSDVENIKKAIKGGVHNDTLIRIMTSKTAPQIAVLSAAYLARHGKPLEKVIKAETSGYYETVLVALSKGPVDYDAFLLREACQGLGTKTNLLNELIIGRSHNELMILRQAYQSIYNKNMDNVIRGEVSMKTKQMFEIALQGRWEDPSDIMSGRVDDDARILNTAMIPGETDEILVCSILLARSPDYLSALANAFQLLTRRSLIQTIYENFQGHMESALVFAVAGGNSVQRDANMIEEAMKGHRIQDKQLIRRIVRAHWDVPRFKAIKGAYRKSFGKELRVRVSSAVAGDYKKALVALCD